MTRVATRAAFLSFALIACAQASPIVDLDFIVLQHGSDAVFGDDFDSTVWESPPWYAVTGSPGPESGSTVRMRAGDMLATTIGSLDPNLDTTIFAGMDLVDFSGDASAALILLGDQPGDSYALSIVPLAAYFLDNTASALGIGPALTSGHMHMEVNVAADGVVSAAVNGIPVFEDELPFGSLTGIAFWVVPEPSTLALLVVGLFATVRRRTGHSAVVRSTSTED